ncbi:hypothetical protein ABIF41_001854 [Bradyrhizobium japonicum]
MLALIDLPDFGTPLRSIAGSVERIADATPSEAGDVVAESQSDAGAGIPPTGKSGPAKEKEHSHV